MNNTISFSAPVVIITQLEISTSIDSLVIESVTDLPGQKLVTATLSSTRGTASIEVWKGSEYDEAGQWTDSDVRARIVELATPENVARWFQS